MTISLSFFFGQGVITLLTIYCHCCPLVYGAIALLLLKIQVKAFDYFLGGAVFWVLGASFFCIILHASFHNFDALQDGNSGENGEAVLIGNITEDV